ncbi:MAG: nuclear transport factor 2 family protein [Polyangiaceae bacterium]|jgi:ketosteroid isomerase-like protein|nr:nuclear transport factor 2 family protein [Polyangiaceae bacterium]
MSEDAEAEVRAASDRFYAALNSVCNGNAKPMEDVWSHADDASASHPMGDWSHGWEQIRITWEEFARSDLGGKVTVKNLTVHVVGDFAYTTGVEDVFLVMQAGKVQFRSNATNIFRRENGVWRIVHHHVDKAPDFEQTALADELLSGAHPAWRQGL